MGVLPFAREHSVDECVANATLRIAPFAAQMALSLEADAIQQMPTALVDHVAGCPQTIHANFEKPELDHQSQRFDGNAFAER